MHPLVENLKKNISYNDILTNIKDSNNCNLSVVGITDSTKAYMVYSLTKESKKSSVIVCSNAIEANKMIQDLKFFSDIEVIYFPARSIEYFDIEAESKEVTNQRMYAIEKIFDKELNIIVTTIDALLVKMFPHTTYDDLDVNLKVDNKLDVSKFQQTLVKLGYEKADLVEGKGQFALRGGIIDLYTLNNEFPYRIEMFGDDIDSIRTFDPLTQRSIDTVKEINISYIAETNVSDINIDKVINELNKVVDNDKVSSNLKHNILEDIEKIENGKLENVFDKYFSLLIDNAQSFLDYVENYNIFVNEISRCEEKAHNICYENTETIKALGEREYIYIPFVNRYFSFDEIEPKLKHRNNICLQSLVLQASDSNKKKYIINTRETNFYRNSLDVLLIDLNKNSDKTRVLVFPTKNRVEQIKNYLTDNKVRVKVVEDISSKEKLDNSTIYITSGILSGGFSSDELKLLVVAEPVSGVNYNKNKKNKKSNTLGKNIDSYDDLQIGDYVVHENHGIGIYKGIETIKVQDVQKDYIKIEYSDQGNLYVPINQLDSVKKYICDDDSKPKLNSLGTKEWDRTKKKVTEHVEEIAKELVLLYAKREQTKGFAFSTDTPWQKEFEDSFEYELTNDQKRAIAEVKADMEDSKPMDRLLCGDVGYGKTEVALRAAFKATMDGKQVAYLVPTTVLSLQQYRTFKSRMESFGIKVEMLSRFKSKSEQTKILKDLVDGKIDIVVGTHRLLSKDVFFKDLGMLIIDEEHRFGVKAKESIKALKETVDVLSMTATPIPRTLHMSMIGVRQMSTLTEPPMERLPVHTYVTEYENNVIQNAIEKELLRDGQVFYINNRVENIEEITNKVSNLVPSARVAYAHGQMDPDQIEEIMIKFIEHEIDVLVCTTILESGIDIQNANTLVVENSDKLGLAQLYQIRGRVGRSSRLAYAYITYEKNKVLSEVSEKRLQAIKDFTEFGSGFKIALRDLEIRGAGNLLGKAQHGHMAHVGYEMYLSLLEKAVRTEKSGKDTNAKEEIAQDIKIDLDVSAYISDEYIKDPIQKISMYQQISEIKEKDDMMDVIDELLDRYGNLPVETENLIKIVEIRNNARKLGITRIVGTKQFIKFEPSNFKIQLTNVANNDILLRVQLEINKLLKLFNEKG